jgi:hypothetical protein
MSPLSAYHQRQYLCIVWFSIFRSTLSGVAGWITESKHGRCSLKHKGHYAMIHDLFRIFFWLLAIPTGIFLLAFLAALADCSYAYFFPSPLSALDDSL